MISLGRIFFTFLDLAIPGGSDASKQFMDGVLAIMGLPALTTLSVFLLLLAVFFVLAYMLSYFLLLNKRVFGLFIMFGLDLVGFLLWQFDPVVVFVTAARWLVLSLPWLLTWIDLKRRGVFPGP